MTQKECARCHTDDMDELVGETGKLIRYGGVNPKFPEFRNKVVCYDCWSILHYGKEEEK